MPLYSYTKKKRGIKKKKVLLFALLLVTSGVLMISWVALPIISFEIFYAPKFATLIKPIPGEIIKTVVASDINEIVSSVNRDFTKASIWFPNAAQIKTNIPPTNSGYLLSIPKLKIENASVLIGTDDLSKSLIHFTGSWPGKPGNPVIFGHSTIPWLYNPRDYKAIFTKLPDLNRGDEINVLSDNISYRYKIIDMKIVSPTDLSVLDQQYDDSYLTLVTCVPQGTYLRRLIVKSKLINIQ